MKSIFLIVVLFSAGAFAAGSFEIGTYNGGGTKFYVNGKTVKYTATASFVQQNANGPILFTYHEVLADGTTTDLQLTSTPTGNGFFDVSIQGTAIGQGYCFDQTHTCYSTANFGGIRQESTFIFSDKGLRTRGTSSNNGIPAYFWRDHFKKNK